MWEEAATAQTPERERMGKQSLSLSFLSLYNPLQSRDSISLTKWKDRVKGGPAKWSPWSPGQKIK